MVGAHRARGSLIYENDELRLEKMCLYKSQYCSWASRAVRLHAAEGASLFPSGALADHLVGSCQHGLGDGQIERFGRLKIDDKLEPGGAFDRKIAWFGATENFRYEDR